MATSALISAVDASPATSSESSIRVNLIGLLIPFFFKSVDAQGICTGAFGLSCNTLSQSSPQIVTVPENYVLSFNIIPTGTFGDWTNILHYTKDGENMNGESRVPAIWFHPHSNQLHVRFSTVYWGNDGLDIWDPLPLNFATTVRIEAIGRSVSVYFNDTLKGSALLEAKRITGTATLYTSDPWYVPAKAILSRIDMQAILVPAPASAPKQIVRSSITTPRVVFVPEDFSLVFSIIPGKAQTDSRNILHYSKDGTDISRVLGVWFIPRSLRISVGFSTIANGNIEISTTDPLPVNVLTTVRIDAIGKDIAVYFNGILKGTFVLSGDRITGPAYLYSSNPWTKPAMASLSSIDMQALKLLSSNVGQEAFVPEDYSLSFEIIPTGISSQQSNILHYKKDGKDLAAIWFLPGTLRIAVRISTATNSSDGLDISDPLPINSLTQIKITVIGQNVTVYFNNAFKGSKNVTGARITGNANLMVSDPPAKARISRLKMDSLSPDCKWVVNSWIAMGKTTTASSSSPSDCCSMQGVVCEGLFVMELQWNSLGLSGSISPQLGNLKKMNALSLGWNQLSGSIPPEIGNMENLKHLNFDGNQLSGPIPSSFGKLTKMIGLGVAHNKLSGPIPPEIGNLVDLFVLGLIDNKLTGPIPPQLGNLSNVVWVDLRNNQLSGPIPAEVAKMKKVCGFYLSGNQLNGSIPKEIGQMTDVAYLGLDSNQFSGAIPEELTTMVHLGYLWLNNNPNLTGTFTPKCDRFVYAENTGVTLCGCATVGSPPAKFPALSTPIECLTSSANSLLSKRAEVYTVALSGYKLTCNVDDNLNPFQDCLNTMGAICNANFISGNRTRIESCKSAVDQMTGGMNSHWQRVTKFCAPWNKGSSQSLDCLQSNTYLIGNASYSSPLGPVKISFALTESVRIGLWDNPSLAK